MVWVYWTFNKNVWRIDLEAKRKNAVNICNICQEVKAVISGYNSTRIQSDLLKMFP